MTRPSTSLTLKGKPLQPDGSIMETGGALMQQQWQHNGNWLGGGETPTIFNSEEVQQAEAQRAALLEAQSETAVNGVTTDIRELLAMANHVESTE